MDRELESLEPTLESLERLPPRKVAWYPTYHPLTLEQINQLSLEGLATQRELRLWSENRLNPARAQWITNRLSLMSLVVEDSPVQ